MNDVYVEQLVEKRPDSKSVMTKMLILVAAVVVTFLPIIIDMFLPPESQGSLLAVIPFTLAGSIWGAILLFRRQNLEFEYILANGEFDIDKIMGKRRRKRIINSANCRNFDILAPMIPKYQHQYNNNQLKKLDVSSASDAQGRWFAIFNGAKGVRTLLIFEPNEKMLEGMKKFVVRNKFMTQ